MSDRECLCYGKLANTEATVSDTASRRKDDCPIHGDEAPQEAEPRSECGCVKNPATGAIHSDECGEHTTSTPGPSDPQPPGVASAKCNPGTLRPDASLNDPTLPEAQDGGIGQVDVVDPLERTLAEVHRLRAEITRLKKENSEVIQVASVARIDPEEQGP